MTARACLRKAASNKSVIAFLVGSSVLAFLFATGIGDLRADDRRHEAYFTNTAYELHVYRIHGRTPGPTLMIIGGIQGNEPGGFLAADSYVDLTLKKGNLIVVPRANFYSILKNERGPDGDMNRHFRDAPPENYVERIVEVLKKLMSESDYLLNLHDGSGFYSPKYEGPRRNPKRYGQSIIADASTFKSKVNGRVLHLEKIAKSVIEKVNPQIHNKRHHILFSNHRTLENDTIHPEQRTSATFYALTRYGIPAFGVETSKDIPDYTVRVQYQTMVINAFMEVLGIVPDNPPLTFDPPQLDYVLISINQGIPIALPNREILHVAPDDVVQIEDVVANYTRGISVDVEGVGTENDIRKPLKIAKDTEVFIRKESEVFGNIRLQVGSDGSAKPGTNTQTNGPAKVTYFIIEVNGEKRLVENRETLKIVTGDRLRILEVITRGIAPEELTVNFVGFVGDEKDNTGEDRGYIIRTAKDLWIRYSLNKQGIRYRIAALKEDTMYGEMVLELVPPTFSYLVVDRNGKPGACYEGDSQMEIGTEGEIRILDIKTNIRDNSGVDIRLNGNAPLSRRKDGSWIIRVGDGIPGEGEIEVIREGISMGRVHYRKL